MSESTLTGIKLAVIVAATALLFREAPVFDLPGGFTLLLILFAFDIPTKSMFQSFAFACAGALAAAVALIPIYPHLGLDLGVPLIDVAWFVALLVIFFVDRVRAGNNPAPHPATIYGPSVYSAPPPVPPSPATPYAPPPPAPAPVYTAPPPPPPPAPRPEPVQPHLVRDEPAFPTAPPPPSATPAEPPSGAIALKGGKQVDIYVNLLGEGMNMLRSVKAESLGRDFYHIIDVMPENERWEFKPGQVVRCQKRNLSSGKALVAVEEAPRA